MSLLPVAVWHWLIANSMDFLVIDDDKTFRDATCLLIDGDGHYARGAASGELGLMELKVGKFDSVLLDLNLGRENGLDILEQIHKCQPNLPVIIFTAQGSVNNAVEAMRRGAVDFLEKPFSPDQFRLVLARVQRFQQLNQKIERLEREDLPADLRGQTGSGAKGDGASLEVGSLVSMKQLEEAHLRKVLEQTANFAEAARVLGIDQATLYRKRKKIGLE